MPTIEDFGRYGVELMNKEGTAFAFNDAKGVELLPAKYKELYDAKALDPQALTATPESSGKKFLTEAVAMNPGSALDLGDYEEAGPEPLQEHRHHGPDHQHRQGEHVRDGRDGQLAHQAHSRLGRLRALRHRRAEPDVLRQEGRDLPEHRGWLDDPYFTKEDGTDETRVRIAAAKSLKNAVNYTPVLFSEQMKTALRNDAAKALQGKESPKTALDNAVKACDTLLKQQG